MRYRNASHACRSYQSVRHLRAVGVWLAAHVVMQIVELRHRRKPSLEHLHIKVRGDSLHLRWVDFCREAIHRVAPGPEAVRSVQAQFGQPRHRALKRMGMDVGHAWHRESTHAFHSRFALRFRGH